MGKRELLIIAAFVVLGIGVYELTAPPAKPGEGFSFSRMWRNTQRSVRGNATMATEQRTGAIPLTSTVSQLRIRMGTSGRVLEVRGEDRRDVAFELTVDSSGPDEATAKLFAQRVSIVQDHIGTALDLQLSYPKNEGSQTVTLVVHVPSRLAVRVDSNNKATVSNVASVEIESSGGTIACDRIPGEVSGYHRNGEITVTNTGAVRLTLAGSRATIEHIEGPLVLNARQGKSDLTDTNGAIEIDGASQEVTITRSGGTIRLTGRDGKVTIDDPRADTRVEVRNADVQVTLRRPTPLTLITSDRSLLLRLDGSPAITVDAVATDGGRIVSEDFGLQPESVDRQQKLEHTFGDRATAHATLRNLRANIVIAKAK